MSNVPVKGVAMNDKHDLFQTDTPKASTAILVQALTAGNLEALNCAQVIRWGTSGRKLLRCQRLGFLICLKFTLDSANLFGASQLSQPSKQEN